jgi:hypothetical protein
LDFRPSLIELESSLVLFFPLSSLLLLSLNTFYDKPVSKDLFVISI